MFLSGLPQNLRVLLRGVPTNDLRLLSEAADEDAGLFVSDSGQSGAGVLLNHVSQDQIDVLAAVGGGQQQQKKPQQQQKKAHTSQQKGNHTQYNKSGKTGFVESDENREKRLKAGICLAHWRFGVKCYPQSCRQPCVLSEN